jgi:hypothetical protein
MATFNAYITVSKTYTTTVDAATEDAALAAAVAVDTTSLPFNTDKSVSVRPEE